MNETQFSELQQALATVRRCSSDLPYGRRCRVINLCGRIAQEARKTQPEPKHVTAPDETATEANSLTQRQAILKLLESGVVLSKSNAKQLTGAEDFRKRISELRRMGYPIQDSWTTGKNRYGHSCTYKNYFITPEA